MRTWQAIYEDLIKDTGQRFTLRQLIDIFKRESDWIGTSEQLVQLKALQWEITGIRPGNCTGCNLDVLINMARWVEKYEQENGTNSDGGVRHKPKRKNKVYSTDNK
jgi:hypothetical protein